MISKEKAIQAKLTGLFAQVEPKFRLDTIARYVARAEGNFKSWMELLAGPEPPRDRFYWDATSCPQYVTWDGGMSGAWADKVAAAGRGEYRADIKRATQDAIDSVRYAREHFISKQTKKITNATTLRPERPSIAGTLKYNVLIEGILTFLYKNGDRFDVVMSMIVNHRYTRGYTSFYQFPARFTNVTLGGQPVTARLSEKWMSENFK